MSDQDSGYASRSDDEDVEVHVQLGSSISRPERPGASASGGSQEQAPVPEDLAARLQAAKEAVRASRAKVQRRTKGRGFQGKGARNSSYLDRIESNSEQFEMLSTEVEEGVQKCKSLDGVRFP